MRSDKARNREIVLAAAGRLFDAANDPDEVSMDAVAAAAGVGKGTLFRGFGDRLGLMRALYEERSAHEFATRPAGDDGDPAELALELLTGTWQFKERHRVLGLAFERAGHGSPYANAGYDRWHAELARLITIARPDAPADFLAHALLAAVRSDLVEHLRGHPETDVHAGLRDLVRSVLHDVR
ncbi:TetR/AcrR family transcriptional regulator [Winogradskya consettensis]|uniref:TetR family transcriptional regulator n=1 Tax=Winogradskya consettensis TaxID=113560 RepID=A0A919SZB4_9ACTN|nr:TetR family transcriptional regulator [Actinoplanes consettensis]GIM82017.1 TetR family transcriptional regulator [Actinoplanes consettensis]